MVSGAMRGVAKFAVITGAALVVAACGVKSEDNYSRMRQDLVAGRYDAAVDFIEKQKERFYGETNAVLFYFDKLMALHLAKRFKESNALVEKADRKIDDLYTKSVSAEVGAMLTSDNVLAYEGEDFEKALLHVVGALNYTFMGERDEALVEARRVEQKLTLLNDARTKAGKKNEYSEDAFIRWFIGCLFETEGDDQGLNDAVISYKKALEAYEKSYLPKYKTRVPQLVVQDLLRTAEHLGFQEDLDAVKKRFGGIAYPKQSALKTSGEIVFVHLNGEAPYKTERHWEAIADNKVIKVAYPEFVQKPRRIGYATISVGDKAQGRTEMMEDINAIALQNLQDHMARIKAKMVARAITKFLAAKAAQVAGEKASGNAALGSLLGAAASVAGAATEQADKRSWLLLPSSIDVAGVIAPAGTYKVKVAFYSPSGALLETHDIDNVNVRAGHKTFLSYRSF